MAKHIGSEGHPKVIRRPKCIFGTHHLLTQQLSLNSQKKNLSPGLSFISDIQNTSLGEPRAYYLIICLLFVRMTTMITFVVRKKKNQTKKN